jgi:hypothetical protein
VSGGGPSADETPWVSCRPGFFLPVRLLSRVFRRLFLTELDTAFAAGGLGFFGDLAGLAEPAAFAQRLREIRRLDWVVFAKPPFGGPEQVLAYLGRYTHRVAIANSRLVSLSDDEVAFRWKVYRHHSKSKLMTLAPDEFIRRFLLHALPDGFHRIRHYGFLANAQRRVSARREPPRPLQPHAASLPTAPRRRRGGRRHRAQCPDPRRDRRLGPPPPIRGRPADERRTRITIRPPSMSPTFRPTASDARSPAA